MGSETLQATGEEINPERDVGLHPVAFKDASDHIVPRTNEGGKQPQLNQVSKWRSVLAKNRSNEEKMLIIMKKNVDNIHLHHFDIFSKHAKTRLVTSDTSKVGR